MRINIDLTPQLRKDVEESLQHHESELLLLSPLGVMVVRVDIDPETKTDHVAIWHAIEDAEAGEHDVKIAGITWRFNRRFKREM